MRNGSTSLNQLRRFRPKSVRGVFLPLSSGPIIIHAVLRQTTYWLLIHVVHSSFHDAVIRPLVDTTVKGATVVWSIDLSWYKFYLEHVHTTYHMYRCIIFCSRSSVRLPNTDSNSKALKLYLVQLNWKWLITHVSPDRHAITWRCFRMMQYLNIQGAARLLADLNLAPSALKWWEKGGVGIIRKGTFRSFVFPWVSEEETLVEEETSVRRAGLLFKWPLYYCNSTCLPDPVQYLHWSSTSRPTVDSFMGKHI